MSDRRWHAKRACLRHRMGRDDGTTLIEVMVGITLMTVFMAMFTGAIVMMNTAMNTSQAVNATSSQVSAAFRDLDRLVRYASAISMPGVGASGDWYVELRSTYTGTQVCTQFRVDTAAQQLQRRTWQVLGAVASKPTGWTPISSAISNGSAAAGPTTQPFYLRTPLATAQAQELTVNLVAQSGTGRSQTESTSSFTLAAMNSGAAPPTAANCQEHGRP